MSRHNVFALAAIALVTGVLAHVGFQRLGRGPAALVPPPELDRAEVAPELNGDWWQSEEDLFTKSPDRRRVGFPPPARSESPPQTDSCLRMFQDEPALGIVPLGVVTDVTLAALHKTRSLHTLPGTCGRGGAQPASDGEVVALDLSGCDVTDAGLAALTGLPKLAVLDLSGTHRITGAGLATLEKLGSLRVLNLSRSRVNDEGAKGLQPLKQLTLLDLSDTDVSDKCIGVLNGLAGLRFVNLAGLKFDTAVFAEVLSLDRSEPVGVGAWRGTDTWREVLSELGVLYTQSWATTAGGQRPRTAGDVTVVDVWNGPEVRLAALKGFPGLAALNLGRRSLTRADTKELRSLTCLKTLVLDRESISDEVLRGLHEAGLLHVLSVATTATGGVPRSEDEVAVLGLGHTEITDAGLTELRDLKNLTKLSLAYTKVTGAGFEHLTGLAHLRTLDLRSTQLTDHGLEALSRLGTVTALNLDGTTLSEKGLARLGEFKSLVSLSIQAAISIDWPAGEEPNFRDGTKWRERDRKLKERWGTAFKPVVSLPRLRTLRADVRWISEDVLGELARANHVLRLMLTNGYGSFMSQVQYEYWREWYEHVRAALPNCRVD